MSITIAILASIVAVQYAVIGLYVVPRLAGMAEHRTTVVTIAQFGAGAFFVGCAFTHVGIAVHALTAINQGSAAHLSVVHVVPHIAQVLGGAAFIIIVARKLDIRFAPKDVAVRLREAEDRFRAAFESAPIGMAILSARPWSAGRFLQVNPALCSMVGQDEGALMRLTSADLAHPAYRDREVAGMRALAAGEITELRAERRWEHTDGNPVWVQMQASVVRDGAGQPLYNVTQIRDVTQERRYAASVQQLADRDALTGLFNRRRFEEEVDRALVDGRRHKEAVALLIINLDRFKHINDTYGGDAGDDLIIGVGRALRLRLRESDVLGRIGGDEFAVLLTRTPADMAMGVAETLVRTVRTDASIKRAGRAITATASS